MIELSRRRIQWILVVVTFILIIILGTTLYILFHNRKSANQGVSPTPSPTESVSPSTSPTSSVTPTPTVSPSESPPPSSTPTASVLPSAAQSTLNTFYTAYKNKDRSQIESLFTEDSTEELRSLHSRLFTGLDPQGNPGGPTLFASNSASQSVDSFSVISIAAQEKKYVVTVKEKRLNASGESVGDYTTLITLVPNSTSTKWLIDAYVQDTSAGKYDGFLFQ